MDEAAPFIESLKREWSDFGAIFSWLWGKIKSLLTPVHETEAALDKCGSAGERFGRALGWGINKALTPLRMLIDGLDWVLRKAGIVPDVVQYAQDRADALRRNLPPPKKPMVAVWDPATKKMTLKPWDWSAESDKPSLTAPDNPLPKPPLKAEFSTALWDGVSKNSKRKKKKRGEGGYLPDANVGHPGAILFKTLPPWLALKNGFSQPTLSPGHGGILAPPGRPPCRRRKNRISVPMWPVISICIFTSTGQHGPARAGE